MKRIITQAQDLFVADPMLPVRCYVGSLPLLFLSLVGAHPTPRLAGPSPVSVQPVAEATIHATEIVLPVTIHGQTLSVIPDLGTTLNILSSATVNQLGVPLDADGDGVLDTLAIGTSVHAAVPFSVSNGFDAAVAAGLLGAPLLSHYDFLVDGPAGRVRVYARATTRPSHRPPWFPAGITPVDCTPMHVDEEGAHRVFFDLQVNGHPLHSMFDSGSHYTNINLAAARLLGLTLKNPNVHPMDESLRLMQYPAIHKVTGLTLTLGATHRPLTAVPVVLYTHFPRETTPDDAEVSLGFDALRDRLFVVSYSTRQVCLL